MAVLLEGINIPEENPITINIYRNGTWVNAYTAEDGNAIEVPEPHGDLIDRDKLRAKEFIHNGDAYAVVMSRDIRNAPTVIRASVEGEA